jgi:hypothetical protein
MLALALAGVVAFGACKKADTKTAPSASATPAASAPTCACEARQVCVQGRCAYDSVYFEIQGVALGAPSFACAVYAGGEVWCAGKNTVGELGNGKPPAGAAAADEAPARVIGLANARKVVAGTQHACALVTTDAWCWGNGSSTPSHIAGLGEVSDAYAGKTRTCAVSNEGTVACWGADGIAKPVKGVAKARVVAVGDERACAVVAPNGRVVCWGKDGVVSMVEVGGIDELVMGNKIACARPLGDGPVACWGGRFGPKPSVGLFLASAKHLAASGDLVCGIDHDSVVRCSDPKMDYRVTLGDSGTRASARLLAVSGTFSMNVHVGDDVVDADDDLPGKRNFDMLGENAPRATLDDVRAAKGFKRVPAQPAAPSVLSCVGHSGGTCTEYPPGSGRFDEEEERCRNGLGTWSSSPCSREKVLGTCVIGTQTDRGALLVIYDSPYTKGVNDAHAMCEGAYEGKFSPR